MFGDWIKKGIGGLSGLFGGGNNNNQQAQVDAQRQADLAAQRQREEAERKRREEEERKRREEAAAEARRRAEEQARARQQQEVARRQQEQANPLRVPTTPTSLNVNQNRVVQPQIPQSEVQKLKDSFLEETRRKSGSNFFGNFLSGGNNERLAQNDATNMAIAEMNRRNNDNQTKSVNYAMKDVVKRQADVDKYANDNPIYNTLNAPKTAVKGIGSDITGVVPAAAEGLTSGVANTIKLFDEENQFANKLLKNIQKDRETNQVRRAVEDAFGYEEGVDNALAFGLGKGVTNLARDAALVVANPALKVLPMIDRGLQAHQSTIENLDRVESESGNEIPFWQKYLGATVNAGGQAALENVGLNKLMSPNASRLAMSLSEGGEEVGQQFIDNGVNRAFDNKQDLTEGLLDSAILGTTIGSLAGGGKQSIERIAPKTDTGRPSKFMTQGAVEVNPQTDLNDSDVPARKDMPMSERYVEPQTLYHGTNADFDKFDLKKAGTRNHNDKGEFGQGIYLTPNREIASSYGKNVKEVVADLKKTYKIDSTSREANIASKNDLIELINKTTGENIPKDIQGSGLQVSDFIYEYGPDKISQILKKNGHDGVVVNNKDYPEVVVFDEKVIQNHIADTSKKVSAPRSTSYDSPDVSKQDMINEADNIQTNDLISQLGAEQPTPAVYTASPSPETGGVYGDTQQTPNISETLNETIGSATTDNTGIAAQRLQQAIKGSVNQDIKKQSYNAREVAQAVNEFYDSTTPMEAASGLAGLEINGANDILAANELIQRLEKDNMTLKNPAIREAMLAAGDRISKKSSNAGSDLRATAEFHQNLPTELWIENVKRDLAESGQALTPDQEANLKSKKDALKSAGQKVKAIYRNANKLADEMGKLIRKGKMTDDMATEYDTVGKKLAEAQQAADRTLKIANDSLRKDLRKTSKDGAFRKSVDTLSNGYRTLLLSSPSGRLADVGSTLLKSVDKLASSTVSNAIGKVANKINPEAGLRQGAGAGTAEAFVRGSKRGGQRVKDIFTNQQNPDARMGETIGGLFGRGVQAMTGVAPAITEGAMDVRLLNTVRAQLKAEFPNATNRQLDSMARIAAVAERGDPTSGAFNEATRYHNEINMTGTDNVISKNVDKVINKMEKQPALKAVATLTAPFARFSANSAYNTARRNPIGDLVALGKNIKDGNTQGIVDNLGELAVDTAKIAAYAAARGAGGLEDEDNDGQTYESNYIKWNDNATSPLDRVAVSDNTNATLGKSISDLQSGSDLKDVVGNALGETVNDIPGRVFDNMTNNSVARALGKLTDYRNSGGENLENTAKELSKLFNPVYNSDDTMKFGDSNISVPFASSPLGRDIRTQIDSKQSFGDRIIQNPARSEATQNRRDNEKSAANLKPGDWFSINASETKKDNGQTVNKQTIARNDGKDPSFKGDISNLQSHMKNSGYSDDQVNDAINMLSMTKNEVLRDFETNGSQNAVRRHANAYLEALRASDANTTDVRKAERFLKLAEVNEKYDVPVELQQAYNKTDLSTWRAMEEDNPELFKLLYQYGQALADAGISKKSTESGMDSASESNTNKYYAKKSRKGSGSGSGGSGGSGKGISTSVGTIKVEDNNTGVKSRSIATPKSYIPGLQKLNSTPQLKKISVKDGFKY